MNQERDVSNPDKLVLRKIPTSAEPPEQAKTSLSAECQQYIDGTYKILNDYFFPNSSYDWTNEVSRLKAQIVLRQFGDQIIFRLSMLPEKQRANFIINPENPIILIRNNIKLLPLSPELKQDINSKLQYLDSNKIREITPYTELFEVGNMHDPSRVLQEETFNYMQSNLEAVRASTYLKIIGG